MNDIYIFAAAILLFMTMTLGSIVASDYIKSNERIELAKLNCPKETQ